MVGHHLEYDIWDGRGGVEGLTREHGLSQTKCIHHHHHHHHQNAIHTRVAVAVAAMTPFGASAVDSVLEARVVRLLWTTVLMKTSCRR